jgi:hypothetical protein
LQRWRGARRCHHRRDALLVRFAHVQHYLYPTTQTKPMASG